MSDSSDRDPIVMFDPDRSLADSGVLEAIADLMAPLTEQQQHIIRSTLGSHWLEGMSPSRRDVRAMIAVLTGDR